MTEVPSVLSSQYVARLWGTTEGTEGAYFNNKKFACKNKKRRLDGSKSLICDKKELFSKFKGCMLLVLSNALCQVFFQKYAANASNMVLQKRCGGFWAGILVGCGAFSNGHANGHKSPFLSFHGHYYRTRIFFALPLDKVCLVSVVTGRTQQRKSVSQERTEAMLLAAFSRRWFRCSISRENPIRSCGICE